MSKSQNKLATVVITTRNRKELLRDAITSTLAQQEQVEIIVMDDASTDGTGEMVRAEFPMVRLVHRGRGRQRGGGHARNSVSWARAGR